jgi:hypothetical protein
MSKPPAEHPSPRIRVTSPCAMRWEALTPVPGGRHCAACQKTVIDVERLSTAELDALVDSGERACVRMATLPDGSVLTRDHPRAPRRAAAWAGAALAASTFACAEGVREDEVAVCADAPTPEAPPATIAEVESSIDPRVLPLESPPALLGRETVVVSVGGLEPAMRGGLAAPPAMPALDLSRPLSESGEANGETTIALGSIGESLSVVDDDFLQPFRIELD